MTHFQTKRARRTRQQRQRRASRIRFTILIVLGIIVGGVLVGGLALNREINTITHETAHLNIATLGQNTSIFDRDSHLLGVVAGTQNRTIVTSAQIPPILKEATVAIEDKRFYHHHGVDYLRLLGAAAHDVSGGGGLQGGSTITMQLMKVLVLGGNDHSVSGKIKEAYLALHYEKSHTKDQILTDYLNSVFYGNNAVGVEAASVTYFNRHVENISLAQAALLAGLPQAPTQYNPLVHPVIAKERRNEVLAQMAAQGYVTPAAAAAAERQGLELNPGTAYTATPQDGYFFEYVKQNLEATYGQAALADDGLKIYTTIDPKLDNAALNAINSQLGSPGDPEAALVMMDTHTGAIRAMQSTQPFGPNSQFNYATEALRQPGSTFKTFVLAAAINQGINPDTTYYVSHPLNFVDPNWGAINVQTYSNTYPGRINIHNATLQSDNSVYTQLTLDVGPQAVVDTAYTLGIPRDRNLPVVASIGLGSGVVTPLDMTTAYSALSNGGQRVTPLSVTQIVPPDGPVITTQPSLTRVISDGVAYGVTQILHDNVLQGTAVNANIAPNIAGKTGTTNNYVDAWFVGYTPCYAAAVWVGYPNASGTPKDLTNVHGIHVTGGSFPAKIWAAFMEQVLKDPRYACPAQGYPVPTTPLIWKPFTSKFSQAVAPTPTPTTPTQPTTTAPPTHPTHPTHTPTPSPQPTAAPPPPSH